jgi:hypothetical protein
VIIMTLLDIVTAIVAKNKISPKEIENVVMFLTSDGILDDLKTLRRLTKKLNELMEYEESVSY